MPVLFKTSLADGLATIERWAKSLPPDRRAENVRSCCVHADGDQWTRTMVFEVPGTAGTFFKEIAGDPIDGGVDGDRIALDSLPDRLLLQPSRPERGADSLLVLFEGLDSDDIAETLLGLADLGTSDQVILRLEFEEGRSVRGVELFGVIDAHRIVAMIGSASLHQVRHIGNRRFATPHGMVHPLAEMCPTILQAVSGPVDFGLWRESASQRATGAFHPCRIVSSEPRLPADLFEVTDALAATDPVGSSAEPPSIPIHLIPSSASLRSDEPEVGSIIMEVHGANAGRARQRLLDLLDEVQSGILDEETTIWTSRSGSSEISPTTYHIWLRSNRDPQELASTGVRIFVQPRAYEDCGLPLFVEYGAVLRPPLERVYEVVGKDHPVFHQLRDRFPAEKDGRPCRHLLRRNPHGDPSHVTLQGGERLIDLIDEIVLATHAVTIEGRSSTDATEGSRMADRITEEKAATDQRIASAGHEASAAIQAEFESVLADLDRVTSQLESQLQGLKQRVDALRSITSTIDKAVTDAPRTWWSLSEPVNRVDREILEGRESWLKRIDDESEVVRNDVAALRSRLEDASRIVNERLQKLRGLEASARDARSQFDDRIESAEKTRRRFIETVADAEEMHAQATQVLEMVQKNCDAEARRLDAEATRINERRSRLDATQRAQATRRQQQDAEQQQLSIRGRQLKEELQRLEQQAAAIKAEIDRLHHLEHTEIPGVERDIKRFSDRLSGIDKDEIERRAARLREERERMRIEWETLRARSEQLDREAEEIAAERTQQDERRAEVSAKQRGINARRQEADDAKRELNRREAELAKSIQRLKQALKGAEGQGERIRGMEEEKRRLKNPRGWIKTLFGGGRTKK